MSLWLWAFPTGCGRKQSLSPSLPGAAGNPPRTHVLEGQKDGQDEPTEEERHEQHEERALAGGEVKLQGGAGVSRLGRRCSPRTQRRFPSRPPARWAPQVQLAPSSLTGWGPKLGAPHAISLPAGPTADLGLEAEDGHGEADEGRDAEAQQHRRGVVVTAGPGPGSVSSRASGPIPDLLPPPPPFPRVLPGPASLALLLGPALSHTLDLKSC